MSLDSVTLDDAIVYSTLDVILYDCFYPTLYSG